MAHYQYMMSAEDVAEELNCSKSHAYKLIKSMNKELSQRGYVTMAGRIPRAFWVLRNILFDAVICRIQQIKSGRSRTSSCSA